MLAELPIGAPIERYGRYQLIEQIGQGGMAEVFRAVSEGVEGFRRVFVIKRIRPEKSDSAEFIQMFCDEARICALLHHPNIVQVYDFGQINGSYFMAMEYLRGKDLSSVLRALRAANGAVPPPVAAFVAQQAALGLHHAHTASFPGGVPGQIVHRDVTPSNIMLLRTGAVKILDFGIAKAAAMARQADTQSGRVKGKLAYLSPEQVRAGNVDGRSDVFALGVVLWEMLAGQRLFAGENEFQTMRNVLLAPVAPPSSKRPGVPAALDAVAARALERDAGRRYPSAQAMADDLERFSSESRCSSQDIPRLLDQLFGEDAAHDTTDPAALSRVDLARAEVAASAAAASAQIAQPVEVSASITDTAPPAGDRARRARRRLLAVAAAGTLVACFAWAGLSHRRHAAARAPSPLARALPAPARPAAPARPPVEPTVVAVVVESTPVGATVYGSDGAALGATPLSLSLPRSSSGTTLTLRKPGYTPGVYTVIADRAQTLRAALETAPARPARAHAAVAPTSTTMTIDPFK